MNGRRIIEAGMAAGVATGAIIVYVTGAWWTVVPIGLGLWVAKITRDTLEKEDAAPAATPKKGAK